MIMKFFPKIPRAAFPAKYAALFLILIVVVAQAKKPLATPDYEAEIKKLEMQEFEASSSLEIKELLARSYWCGQKKGLAVEKWLWLLQFFPNHTHAEQWTKNVELASLKSKKLSEDLKCR